MRFLCFCIPAFFCFFGTDAQDTTLSIDKWVHALSIKKDHRFENLYGVLSDVQKYPVEAQCDLVSRIEESGPSKNVRFEIRIQFLRVSLENLNSICHDSTSLERLKYALQKAYEIEDDFLIAELNDYLCWHFILLKDYSNAVIHGLIAREIQIKTGLENFHNLTISRSRLALALYHTYDYKMCTIVSREALATDNSRSYLSHDTLDIQNQMYAWNTLGLSYLKLNNYDSAFIAFRQALQINTLTDNAFWAGLIKGNIGDVFFQKGEYDSAAVFLAIDIDQSIISGQLNNAANSMQWLAQIKTRDDPEGALVLLRQASSYLERMPQPTFHANLLYAYTQVFASMGIADSVNLYMQQYLAARDALDREVYNSRSKILRGQIENQQFVHQIRTLSNEKERILMIRNFTIVFALILGLAGYFYLNRQRLKMRLRQEQALREKQKAERAAESAQEQLRLYTEHLLEKTQLVERLQGELLQREQVQQQAIEDLEQNAILTEDDWEKFKTLFESVHPGFFAKLKQISPDITVAELRMAAMLKLQIPARKSAAILGISQNSVYKTRQRLRNRLGLGTDAELLNYFDTKDPQIQ